MALVPRCSLAAEIGADHGITSASLLRAGVCDRMIVSDISAASLDKARRLFLRHGLTDRASFRVADGLDALCEPVDACVIAGMGAGTMCKILAGGLERIGGAALVLQPNLDLPLVRRWLMDNGFVIDAEALVNEGRRYYVILRGVRGTARYSEKELLLGPCLLRERPEPFAAYLAWRRDCLRRMRGEEARQAIEWIEEAL